MRRSILGTIALAGLAGLAALVADPAPVRADVPVTMRGSLSAMERQHGVALELGFPFVRTPGDLIRLEVEGALVRLEGNDDYGFRAGVRSLVGRPEMRTFVERLAADYRAACDEKLVITSLTRPASRQPSNAHRLSVHPAGIAVDLRVSRRAECRAWLEDRLLAMEEADLLDVTKERYPPHYHIALFPAAYTAFIAPLIEAEREREARERAAMRAARPLHALVAAPAPPVEGRPWEPLAALAGVALVGIGLRRRRPGGAPGRAG